MTIIIILMALGVLLIVLDIVFIPGMIIGIFGGLLLITGVVLSYATVGTTFGNWALISSVVAMIIILIYCFKTDVWSKFALKDTIASRVNEEKKIILNPGDEGKAVSVLRPSGKAEFKDEIFEVHTLGHYCEPGKKLKIVSVTNSKIFVEPID